MEGRNMNEEIPKGKKYYLFDSIGTWTELSEEFFKNSWDSHDEVEEYGAGLKDAHGHKIRIFYMDDEKISMGRLWMVEI